MQKKFGLIIQGPLVSIGRGGKDAHILKATLEQKSEFIHYDCRENITKIIKDYGDIFDSIVISTWENEVKENDYWDKAELIISPDPGEIQRKKYMYRSRNKHRQFIGIQAGIKSLEKKGSIDYVVRIRTDQYVDIRLLVKSFITEIEKNENDKDIIGVPLTRPDDFMAHDLYFVSRLETLKNFCDAILSYDAFEFMPCVHRDMLLKHAYKNYNNKLEVKLYSYFPFWPPLGASKETKKIFSFMYKNIFKALGREVYETVIARGSYQSKEHIDEQYINLNNNKKNRLNIPSIISIDWERYFNFKKLTTGRKISLMDKTIIYIGQSTWKLMNNSRKFIRKFIKK